MFFSFSDSSVALTGRWATVDRAISATAPGSSFRIAFSGSHCRMDFDLTGNTVPMPHLWISVDGGARVEAPLDWHLRIDTIPGEHTAEIILKSAMEMQHRWHRPLSGKVSFLGYEAEGKGVLPEDNRKIIEWIGDSITEGVLIDAFLRHRQYDQEDRPYQDDACATYAWLTAQALGLRSYFFAYGAVGITKGGCGGTLPAGEMYPYCFENAPTACDHPDFVVINHGANDRGAASEYYLEGYRNLLIQIRETHPEAKIIVLSAFVGVWPEELEAMVSAFNQERGDDVFFISTSGWIPKEPLHPLRDGHRIIAEHLIPILKEKYNL